MVISLLLERKLLIFLFSLEKILFFLFNKLVILLKLFVNVVFNLDEFSFKDLLCCVVMLIEVKVENCFLFFKVLDIVWRICVLMVWVVKLFVNNLVLFVVWL